MRLISSLSLGLILTTGLFAQDNSYLLSKIKQDILKTEKQQNELNSDNLQYSWINAITGNLSHNNSDVTNTKEDQNTLSVTMNQPIFKSGGIYYAIEYAKANRNYLRIMTKNSEQSQIKTVLSALYNIKKIALQIEKEKYLIDNAKIDILRKKEQYDSGFLDSSYLNQAILTKTALDRALMDLKSSQYSMIKTLKAYSDVDYHDVVLPRFTLVDQSKFLQKSLNIKEKDSDIMRNDYLKKMTISSYLPTISFNAGYYHVRDYGKNEYRTLGLTLSMPLFDANRGRTIELARLDYLKSKLKLADTKRDEKENYNLAIHNIKLLQQKITLAHEDVKLYDSLLASTQDSYKAGEKTIYDVQTLENTKKTMEIDAKIFDTEIQLALLDLYAKMNGEI
ncbi:TolC family protein [Sulfurospirillum sp. 1612]|uniref:TolC family protein n=1 Tax=Sulfurospirillum sp. 1612 TaxID=3094835 RepID=UPI002F95D47D